MKPHLVRFAIALLALTMAACVPRADDDLRRFQLTGTVVSVDTSSSRVVVALADRAALLAHAQAICGVPINRESGPGLRRALALKPRPEDFM